MKITTVSVALTSALAFTSIPFFASGADYSTNVASHRNWDAIVWTPTGTPGGADTVTDITGAATRNIYLDGNRALGELGKTTTGIIRFYNGAMDSGADAAGSVFDIGSLEIARGGYLFRSQEGGALEVNVGVLKVGDDAVGSATTGDLAIGNSDGFSNVEFTVAERTELHHRVNLTIAMGGGYIPKVDLGHVVFNNASSQLSQIWLGSTSGALNLDFRTKAASLSTAVAPSANNTNLIRGQGVLVIDGDIDDARHPTGGVARFEGLIQDNVRVEKTGSNIQFLTRAGGNTYKGGTLISGGVLAIESSINSALGSGEVLVTGDGALAGSGLVRPGAGKEIIVRDGGRLAPSADLSTTAQRLRLDARDIGTDPLLRAQDDARFVFTIFEDGNDQIALLNYKIGNFLIEASEGAWIDIGGDVGEGVFVLFSFHESDENSALVAAGLSEGLVAGSGFDGFEAFFHYDSEEFGGLGTIALELRAIPEPGHYALLLIVGAGWVIFSRSRKAVLNA